MKVLKIYGILFLLSVSCHAQYPGGVSANLRGWYNGNLGITLTGGAVSQWNDQSGNGFNATQGTATSRPSQNTNGFNYNSMVTFDGQDNFLKVTDLMATGATGVSAFAVARQTGTGNDTWGCVILGQANGPAWTGGGYGLTALNAGNTSFGFWIRDYSANVVAKATTLSVPSLMSGVWNGTTPNNIQYFEDGTSQGTDAYTPGSVGDNGNTYIGTGFGTGTDYCFYGDIAEIAVYNTGLTAANANKVNSYLAIKYGITLTTNYVNTAGTTIFTTASPYTNNIIGIGREDNNTLTQKQSHNYNDSVRVYISTLAATNSANAGSFASNVSYVITGSNTGRLVGIKTEKPASMFSRLEREWKVTNTNFSSTFNMDVKLSSSANLGSVSISDLRLLVDDDGDFSNATVYAAGGGLSFSYFNPVITVSGIGTSIIAAGTTSYITIASAAGTTPLPIELLNFKATACNNMVCLNWQTASEKNNDHFLIERSIDAANWETIKEVKGAGNSSALHTYSELDNTPLHGISYYRLNQFDFNNENTYSPVISIDNNSYKGSGIKIYPNPSDEYVIIEASLPGAYTIYLTNSLGEKMNSNGRIYSLEDGTYKIETAIIPEGIYYLQIISSSTNSYQHECAKLVIKH